MARIRLSNPTGRNTKAHVVSIGEHNFYFSYETCIAYDGPLVSARIPNSWGPTTGRHFRELGVANYPIVDSDDFDTIIGFYGDPQIVFDRRLLALVNQQKAAA